MWDDADAKHEPRRRRSGELKPDDEIRRVVLCSGKVYYDLLDAREAAGIDDVYLMRVEQLYPFPAKALVAELGRFPQAEIVWAQEEPRNMGPWTFVEPNLEWVLEHVEGQASRVRATSAAPPPPRRRPGRPPSMPASRRRWSAKRWLSSRGERCNASVVTSIRSLDRTSRRIHRARTRH